MTYTEHVDIALPIDRVIELFDNPDNLVHWQPGLQSVEHLSGEPGQPGAKSLLRYKFGKREFEMVETVHTRNLPQEFTGSYEIGGMYNEVRISFAALDGNTTRLTSDNTFRLQGWRMKLMAALMPGSFRKQTRKYLEKFREFAESQG
ncbi:MAG: SRPBCC family protein [Saprospiraceae bacterium]|nr:SRPBCC family protein [Saprospiraceae bacterium]